MLDNDVTSPKSELAIGVQPRADVVRTIEPQASIPAPIPGARILRDVHEVRLIIRSEHQRFIHMRDSGNF